MLPVKSCGIGVVCNGLAQSQECGSRQLLRKLNMEVYSRPEVMPSPLLLMRYVRAFFTKLIF